MSIFLVEQSRDFRSWIKGLRDRRAQERSRQGEQAAAAAQPTLHVLDGGERVPLNLNTLHGLLQSACANLGDHVQADPIVAETMRNLYDGVPLDEVYKASILAARTLADAAPCVPCTARNAFMSATAILFGSKGTTAPLRRMIW